MNIYKHVFDVYEQQLSVTVSASQMSLLQKYAIDSAFGPYNLPLCATILGNGPWVSEGIMAYKPMLNIFADNMHIDRELCWMNNCLRPYRIPPRCNKKVYQYQEVSVSVLPRLLDHWLDTTLQQFQLTRLLSILPSFYTSWLIGNNR